MNTLYMCIYIYPKTDRHTGTHRHDDTNTHSYWIISFHFLFFVIFISNSHASSRKPIGFFSISDFAHKIHRTFSYHIQFVLIINGRFLSFIFVLFLRFRLQYPISCDSLSHNHNHTHSAHFWQIFSVIIIIDEIKRCNNLTIPSFWF